MQVSLRTFGPAHLTIVGAVPLFSFALVAMQRRFPRSDRGIRTLLAALLLACTLAYYGSFVVQGEAMFPDHLPLELCDVSLWLVIAVLLMPGAALFDVVYYWGLVGAGVSVLTPNLRDNSAFMVAQYFADHGLIVVAVLYMVWSRQARPRRGSVGRAVLALNLFAAAVGAFDWRYGTNYMYLRVKPQAATLMDVLGPWPWYIASCEGVALGSFLLLYLPFRRSQDVSEPAGLEGAAVADGGEENW